MVDTTSIAAGQLRSIVERIERIHEDRAALGADLRDVYADAKANGFNTKAIKAVVAARAKDKDELAEFEAVLDLYKQALGMA